MPVPITFRPATVADADALARGVVDGVEDYPSFMRVDPSTTRGSRT